MSNHVLDFLKELQKTLKTQEKDHQAHPRFWVIMDYRYLPTNIDYADRTVFFLPDNNRTFTPESLKTHIPEINGDEIHLTIGELSEFGELMEDEDYDQINKWLQKHVDDQASVVDEMHQAYIVPNTLFLTKEDAQNHLKNNAHHYTKDAHTYAMTALRSPSVHTLWDILEETDWDRYSKNKESK